MMRPPIDPATGRAQLGGLARSRLTCPPAFADHAATVRLVWVAVSSTGKLHLVRLGGGTVCRSLIRRPAIIAVDADTLGTHRRCATCWLWGMR